MYNIEEHYKPLNEKDRPSDDQLNNQIKQMTNNYPPDHDPRLDSGEEEDETLFDENGNYIGPDANTEDARLDDQE